MGKNIENIISKFFRNSISNEELELLLNFILKDNVLSSSISFKKILIQSKGTNVSSPIIVESKYDKTSYKKNNSRK